MREWLSGWPGWAKALVAIAALLVFADLVTPARDDNGDTKVDRAAKIDAPTTTTAKPVTTAAAPPRLSLKERLRARIVHRDIGGTKTKAKFHRTPDGYEIDVTYDLADNLTGGLVRSGAKNDAKDLFQAAFDTPDGEKVALVTVSAMAPLVDKRGHESRGIAYQTIMDGETGNDINWENRDAVDFGLAWENTIDRIG